MNPTPSLLPTLRKSLSNAAERRATRRLKRQRVAAAVATAALIVGGVVTATGLLGRESAQTVESGDQGDLLESLAVAGTEFGLPEDTEVPGVAVWTGTEVLFWSTRDGFFVTDQAVVGLALDPSSGAWRDLAAPPTGDVEELAVVGWTGTELIVCCGKRSSEGVAFSYDASTDRWQTLPAPPVAGRAIGEWTGSELLVATAEGIASYDPTRQDWAELPSPQFRTQDASSVWDGDQWILWGRPVARIPSVGAIYDLESQEWNALAVPDTTFYPALATIESLDGSLYLLGGLPARTESASERFVASRLENYSSDRDQGWTSLDPPVPEPVPCECNLNSQTAIAVGDRLFIHLGSLASSLEEGRELLVLDAATDQWRFAKHNFAEAPVPVVQVEQYILFRTPNGFVILNPDQL